MTNSLYPATSDNFYQLNSSPGVGDDQNKIKAICEDNNIIRVQQTANGRLRNMEIEDLIRQILDNSYIYENWDCEGAKAISIQALREAYNFIKLLSPSIPFPEIVPENTGDIGLEWFKGNKNIFVVSFNGNREIMYAGIINGLDRTHGTTYFLDNIPEIILLVLKQLYDV